MASALVLLLVIASLPLSSSTNARSIDVDISVMKYDWLSNETIELVLKCQMHHLTSSSLHNTQF